MSCKHEESTHDALFNEHKINFKFLGSKPRIHEGSLESTR